MIFLILISPINLKFVSGYKSCTVFGIQNSSEAFQKYWIRRGDWYSLAENEHNSVNLISHFIDKVNATYDFYSLA